MRAGEMTSEPEKLERKQRAQHPTEPWQSAIGKKTKDPRTKGKGKAVQDLEALDDFFEGEDSGANGDETNETDDRDDALPVFVPTEVPAKRRRDKSTTRLKRDFEPVEKHSKKAKHKKHRGQATTPTSTPTPIVQDRFFDDDLSG